MTTNNSRKMLNLLLLLASILVILFIIGVSATGSLVRSASRVVGIIGVPVISRTQAKLAMGALIFAYHAAHKGIYVTYVNSVAWSSDGNYIACATGDEAVHVLDPVAKEKVLVASHGLQNEQELVYDLGGDTFDSTVIEIKAGLDVSTFTGSSPLWAVAVSPDGNYIAPAGRDGIVQVWQVSPKMHIYTYTGQAHAEGIWSLAFSLHRKRIASGDSSGVIQYSTSATKILVDLWPSTIDVFYFAGHGKNVLSESRQQLKGDVESNRFILGRAFYCANFVTESFPGQFKNWFYSQLVMSGGLTQPKLSPERAIELALERHYAGIAWTFNELTVFSPVYLLDCALKDMVPLAAALETGFGFIPSSSFLVGSRVFLFTDGDPTPDLLGQAKEIRSTWIQIYQGHMKQIHDLKWSPDGQVFASGSWDSTIRLWDVQTWQTLRSLQGYTSPVFSVAWSPDGRMLASGSWDSTIRLWDVQTGQALRSLQGHFEKVYSVAWSRITSDDESGTIPVWNASKRSVIYNYPIGGGTLLEPAMQEALNLLHQKSTPSGSRAIVITDEYPTGIGYDRPHQFSIARSIDPQGGSDAAYAEQSLHVRQVAFFVDPVDWYSKSLAKAFSQQFIADAYRGRAQAYKLNYEMLKRLAVKSSEITGPLDNTQEGLER